MLELLKTIISDFHQQQLPERIVPRDLAVPSGSGKVISVIGPRRAGKTYYLYSLISKLRDEADPHSCLYINFEDERLPMETPHLQLILDAYQQLYPDIDLADVTFFFDEVQEVVGWERFVRRLVDAVSTNVFITGSSSKLLGREIASALRGRTLPYTLLPFSFAEYLRYYEMDVGDVHSTRNRNRIIAHFDQYLARGGYPEVIDYDQDIFVRTLQSYVDIMMYRDVIERYAIGNVHVVRDMVRRLIASNAMTFSVHKYFKDLRSRGVRVSKDTLYSLLDHFFDAYLVLPLNRFDPSVAKQEQALKKISVNDTGLAASYTFDMSANIDRLLETTVFLELKKRESNVFSYADDAECDFVVEEGGKITSAIQVSHTLTDENRAREIRGLVSALKSFRLREGLLLTHLQEEDLDSEGFRIAVRPVWKWALGARS